MNDIITGALAAYGAATLIVIILYAAHRIYIHVKAKQWKRGVGEYISKRRGNGAKGV